MGSSAIHFEVVGAEVTRLKFPFDQSLPTSAPTSLVTRILGVWGGAATPPYHTWVGWTCRSAVTSSERAQRCSQPTLTTTATRSHQRAHGTTRQRLGLRREAPLCEAPDVSSHLENSGALENGAATALRTALQDAGARIQPPRQTRGVGPIRSPRETGMMPVLP